MRTHFRLCRLGCLLLGCAGLLQAQTQVADVVADRTAQQRTATATFLERTRPKAERLEAGKKLGYPEDATLPALLAIGADPQEDDAIRFAAFYFLPYDKNYLDAVLKVLKDPNDGDELLDASLIENLSQRTTFKLPPQDAQRIQGVLRELLTDKRDQVRLYAFRSLVWNHDSGALNLLTESLRRAENVPIPLPEAIELLDDDGSVNHISTLRPYLNHADPQVQAQAARALAVDPQSRPKIVELANSSRTPAEVRLHAIRALAREDNQFASYAIRLVGNVQEDPKIRYAAMENVVGRMNYNKVDPKDQIHFAQTVEKVAAEEAGRNEEAQKLRGAAKELLAYLKKAFPEIQKFYEGR